MPTAWMDSDALTVAVLVDFPQGGGSESFKIIAPVSATGTEVIVDDFTAGSYVDAFGMFRTRATTNTAVQSGSGWFTQHRGKLIWLFALDHGDGVALPEIAFGYPYGKDPESGNNAHPQYITSYRTRTEGAGAISTPDSTCSVGMKPDETEQFPGLFGFFAWPRTMQENELTNILHFRMPSGASVAHWFGKDGSVMNWDGSGNEQHLTLNDTYPLGKGATDPHVLLPSSNHRVRRRSRFAYLRPNATVAAGTWTAAPNGTLHGNTSDGDDTTIAKSPVTPTTSDILKLGIDDPVITVGEPVSVYVRWAQAELVSRGIVARYPFDEAASGTTPTTVVDVSGNGFDLTEINYGSGNMSYTEVGGQRGIESTSTTGTQRARESITASDVVDSMIGGSKEATWTVVVRVDSHDANTRIFAINDRVGSFGVLTFRGSSTSEWRVGVNDVEVVSNITLDLTTRCVIQVVFDTAQGSASDRIKIYRNNVEVTTGGTPSVAQDTTFGVTAGSDDLIAMNRESSSSYDASFDGELFHAALHNVAFTNAERQTEVDILLVDDDDAV
jgi:hypothetical protein